MPNIKTIEAAYPVTGMTVYLILRRRADNYYLAANSGSFGAGAGYPAMTENGTVKGSYELSTSAITWDTGYYTWYAYRQTGGSPAPASDSMIDWRDIYIDNDQIVKIDQSVAAIPTNPLLTDDIRLNNLDGSIAARPVLADILLGITNDHGAGSYVDSGGAITPEEIAAAVWDVPVAVVGSDMTRGEAVDQLYIPDNDGPVVPIPAPDDPALQSLVVNAAVFASSAWAEDDTVRMTLLVDQGQEISNNVIAPAIVTAVIDANGQATLTPNKGARVEIIITSNTNRREYARKTFTVSQADGAYYTDY